MLTENQRQRESVIAFGSDGLNGCGDNTRFVSEHLVEAPHALNHWIFSLWIGDSSIANHVIDKNEAAGMGEFESPFEVAGVVLLVGVDEDKVERRGILCGDFGQCFEGGAFAQVNFI